MRVLQKEGEPKRRIDQKVDILIFKYDEDRNKVESLSQNGVIE